MVKPKGIDDVPIINLTFWSRDVDDAALRSLALDVLQRLKEVPNTGIGFVVGGRSEQIRSRGPAAPALRLRYEPGRARQHHPNGQQRAAGRQHRAGQERLHRLLRLLPAQRRRGRAAGGGHPQQPARVRERCCANVYQGPEETTRFVTYYTGPAGRDDPRANGESAVTLAIAKKKGSNGVTVANDVLAMVRSLKGSSDP